MCLGLCVACVSVCVFVCLGGCAFVYDSKLHIYRFMLACEIIYLLDYVYYHSLQTRFWYVYVYVCF